MTNPFAGNLFDDLTADLENDDPFADLTGDLTPKTPAPSLTQAPNAANPFAPKPAPTGLLTGSAFRPATAQLPAAQPIPTGMNNPFVVRANAERNPIAQKLAQITLEGTKKTDPYAANELTEEQQRQLRRAMVARQMSNVGGEFTVQGVGGAADAALNAAQGLGALVDYALPGQPLSTAVGKARDFVSNELVGQPETMAGMAGRGLGYLAGTVGSYVLPSSLLASGARAATAGSVAQKVLQGMANPLGRMGTTAAGNLNAAGRLASGAMLNLPTNVAMGLSPDNSAQAFVQMGEEATGDSPLSKTVQVLGKAVEPFASSPLGRVAFENLLDAAAPAAFEGVRGLRDLGTMAAGRTGDAVLNVMARNAARQGDVQGTQQAVETIMDRQNARAQTLDARREARAIPLPGGELPMETPAIPSKPSFERSITKAYDRRLQQALDAGNDAEVTRLLERQQEVLRQRPLNVQLDEATAAGDELEIQRVLDEQLQRELAPVQGPQRWRGPQAMAPETGGPSLREMAGQLATSPGLKETAIRGAAGAAAGYAVPADEDNKLRSAIGAGLLAAGGPRTVDALRNLPVGLSTETVDNFADRLYSRLERQIQNAPFARGTAEQWAAALAKGTSKGEREFTGVDAFLQENAGTVLSRQQVQDVFNANRVQLGETRYGLELPQMTEAEIATIKDKLYNYSRAEPLSSFEDQRDVLVRLMRRTPAGRMAPRYVVEEAAGNLLFGLPPVFASTEDVRTRFDVYKVPGERTNYRELLLQKPGNEVSTQATLFTTTGEVA